MKKLLILLVLFLACSKNKNISNDVIAEFSPQKDTLLYYNFNTGDTIIVGINNPEGMSFKFGQYACSPKVDKEITKDTVFVFSIPEAKTYYIEINNIISSPTIKINRRYDKGEKIFNTNVELKYTVISLEQKDTIDTFISQTLRYKEFVLHPTERTHIPFELLKNTVKWTYAIAVVDDKNTNKQIIIQDYKHAFEEFLMEKIGRMPMIDSKGHVNFFFSDNVSTSRFAEGKPKNNKKWKDINEGNKISSSSEGYLMSKTPQKKIGVAFENPTPYDIVVNLTIVGTQKETEIKDTIIKKTECRPLKPL